MVVERYGDEMNFLKLFNPDYQIKYTRDLQKVHCGTAPALYAVNEAYGEETAESWIELQLYNLSEFAGCKGKISIPQVEETAKIILSNFGYLNVAEFMLFCQKMKKCEYGKFYGAVDPMLIMDALSEFVQERRNYLINVENERNKKIEKAKDDAENELRNEYKSKFADAFKESAVVQYNDYKWGGMERLTDDEIPIAVKMIQEKNFPKAYLDRYRDIRAIVESIISKRK